MGTQLRSSLMVSCNDVTVLQPKLLNNCVGGNFKSLVQTSCFFAVASGQYLSFSSFGLTGRLV